MSVRGKQELRNIFVTGATPTQQDFTDFIDSYIASINGITPTPDGEINVPLNYNVMNQIRADKQPFDFEEGTTVVIQTYVQGNDPNGWHEVFPAEVQSGDIFIQTTYLADQNIAIQQIDANRNEIFFFNLSRVSNPDGTWNDFVLHPFIRSINGVMTPYNGDLVIPSEPKNASVFYRVESNLDVTLDNPALIFNGKDNNPISATVDPVTGIIYLEEGKKYLINVNMAVVMINGASNTEYALFSHNEGQYERLPGLTGFITNLASTGLGPSYVTSFVVDGSQYKELALRVTVIGGGGTTRAVSMRPGLTHMIIQEL